MSRQLSRKAVIILPGFKDCEIEKRVLEPLGFHVEELDWQGDAEKLRQGISDAELIFVRDEKLDKETVNAMKQAKGILRCGVGIDNIDLETATQNNIIVANVPDYGADIEVADHTVAMILAAQRRIISRDRQVRQGAWNIAQQQPIKRIGDQTLALLGYGKIARAVEHRMRALGIKKVIACDPYYNQTMLSGSRLVSLDELATQADILSLHSPATKENHHVIGESFLASMKPEAMLVNTARGSLIDESALYQHLKKNPEFVACLDVFEQEPPGKDHPLFELNNTIVSDHTAWYSEQTVINIQTAAAEQARQIVETGDASNRVN